MSDDRSPPSDVTQLHLVNVVEVVAICTFITGGAFVISSVLLGELVTSEVIGSYQVALGGTGMLLGSISFITRWIVNNYA